MATCLMLGKYSLGSLREIGSTRSDKARALIKENGWEFVEEFDRPVD